MPNWDNIEESQGLIPAGQYKCSVVHIITHDDGGNPIKTSSMDEMWKIRFHVDEGMYQGALLYDNLIFSEKGFKRAKFICKRLGLEMTGEFELSPDMLIGKKGIVTVVMGEYMGQPKNEIPYGGYDYITSEIVSPPMSPPETNVITGVGYKRPDNIASTRPSDQIPTDAPPPTDSDLPF